MIERDRDLAEWHGSIDLGTRDGGASCWGSGSGGARVLHGMGGVRVGSGGRMRSGLGGTLCEDVGHGAVMGSGGLGGGSVVHGRASAGLL